MTQAKFERLARMWQKRLRLLDWEITYQLVTEEEMPEEFGMTIHEPEEMRAVVRVRDFDETEATLIHELLHLRLVPFDYSDHSAKETAINLLSACFLKAYSR